MACLAEFRHLVPSQGIQHLLPLLALRRKGVDATREAVYEESDDFEFWDSYFLVDEHSQAGRYYDPFAAARRIRSHPHSNVATARKGTFTNSWRAATMRVEDGETSWKLESDYIQKTVEHCLTKAGVIHKVPLLDLLAWMYRGREWPDDAPQMSLVDSFRQEFHLSPAEISSLFEVHETDDPPYFAEEAVKSTRVLEIVGSESIGTSVPGAPNAARLLERLTEREIAEGLVLPTGVTAQALVALEAGSHLLLAGPPGTGKSTLAERIASAATAADVASGYKVATATADWSTFDTTGGYMPSDDASGRLIFREGIVLSAIGEDNWCVIDELNRADIDKAIGPFISLLGGSDEAAVIELPYRHVVGSGGTTRNEPVRIRRDPSTARSRKDADSGDYIIGRNWRLIATMNTYDRNSLFPLTAAFARRFATVIVAIPDAREVLDALQIQSDVLRRVFGIVGSESLEEGFENPRPLGPAIIRDANRYVQCRLAASPPPDGEREALLEALTLYVLPQYSGLEQLEWRPLRDRIASAFTSEVESDEAPTHEAALARILDAGLRNIQGGS